ncbi:hypothetical protein R1sor_026176 [Riccia sorocarpa]|uniref:BAH domain-containing protein n=1 Tax=Riccia sorocarpa TaxID=122646 RepID=A0ABD3GAN2_9MARC
MRCMDAPPIIEFSTDKVWEPPAGVRNIIHMDGSRMMLAADQLPLKSYAEIKRQTRRTQNIERSTVNEEEEPAAITTAEELRRRVFGERRPIYSGPQRPAPGSAAADRAAHISELTEIHDKSFLAVLADDEISFWICQIIKIIDRNEAGEPKKVQLQWYTTEDLNPYTGNFYPEKRRSNGKGRAVLYKQDVDLEEVTILSFNFIFTTTRRLRKVTERQIRTGLFRIARDRHASLPQNQLDADLQIGSEDDEEADCFGPDDDNEDD